MKTTIGKLASALIQPQGKFQVGDRVEWKDGLKNKKTPAYGDAWVVTRVLENPVTDSECSEWSPYFNEPLDIALATLDADGDLVEYHFDSRRFKLSNK